MSSRSGSLGIVPICLPTLDIEHAPRQLPQFPIVVGGDEARPDDEVVNRGLLRGDDLIPLPSGAVLRLLPAVEVVQAVRDAVQDGGDAIDGAHTALPSR